MYLSYVDVPLVASMAKLSVRLTQAWSAIDNHFKIMYVHPLYESLAVHASDKSVQLKYIYP